MNISVFKKQLFDPAVDGKVEQSAWATMNRAVRSLASIPETTGSIASSREGRDPILDGLLTTAVGKGAAVRVLAEEDFAGGENVRHARLEGVASGRNWEDAIVIDG